MREQFHQRIREAVNTGTTTLSPKVASFIKRRVGVN
jgi:hypothetical protein